MKQEIKSYMEIIKEEIFILSKNLHKIYKEGLAEDAAHNAVINLLRKYNFNIKENYLQGSSSFYGEVGCGHPKICYICEFNNPEAGYIGGSNVSISMSVAAALSLSKVIEKTGGTVILAGSKVESIDRSTLITKINNIFGDIDAAFIGYPNVVTAMDKNSAQSNETLSRLFFHNLKECGVIDTVKSRTSASEEGFDFISHSVPYIRPFITVVEDTSVKYPSREFAECTLSHFAEDRIIKTSEALALTGFDLINNENLLSEAKTEFYRNVQNIKV